MSDIRELTIGQRVAQARMARGMSQETLAGLMDRSTSWVSKIERGALPLDRKSVVLRLAEVLNVDPAALEGREVVPTLNAGNRPISIRELRQALMALSTPVPAAAPAPQLRELRGRVTRANHLRQDARFRELGASLPRLLADIQSSLHVAPEERRTPLLVLLVEALHAARAMAKKLGHLDLAWMAADKAGQAARSVGDPLLLAANAWNHIEVYKASDAPAPAMALADSTLDQLAGGLGSADPGHLSLWGMMHLQAGLISAYWMRRSDADAHLREADIAAQRLAGDANHFDTMFGPTNVAIHRVAIAVELGDAGAALRHGSRLNASTLGRERRARLHIDLARAFHHSGKRDRALNALRTAEKLAPDYVRPHPIVHELVGAQLRRMRPELRAFARRIGVL